MSKSSSPSGRGLLFFTIHKKEKEGKGERNPRSILVIEALRQRGCTVMVLNSLVDDESKFIVSAGEAVPLFDVDCGVNQWSPRPSTTLGTPSWVRVLSTGSCVAVGSDCVAFPTRLEGAARQIVTMFSREYRENGHDYPWGPAPSKKRRSRRERDRLRHPWVQRSHLSR